MANDTQFQNPQQGQQQQQQQAQLMKNSFDLSSTLQPNVNPFQQQQQQQSTQQHQQPQPQQQMLPQNLPTSASVSSPTVSSTTISKSSQVPNVVNRLSDNNSKANHNNFIPSNVKTEPTNIKTEMVSQSVNPVPNTGKNGNVPTSQYQQTFNNESLRDLADLDNLDSCQLFGEITGNNKRKNMKSEEKVKADENSNKKDPKNWRELTSSNANVNLSSVTSQSITLKNDPLSNLNEMTSHISKDTNQNSRSLLTANQNNSQTLNNSNNNLETQMPSLVNTNMRRYANMNQQMNISSSTPVNMSSAAMPLRTNSASPSVTQNIAQNMMQNSPQNPHSMLVNKSQNPQAVPPPNLQRTANFRQQLAERLSRPQQQQPLMLNNMTNNGLSFLPNSTGPRTTEKLQELLKRREQFRMMQMQQQMPKNQFMSQSMMSSTMQQQMQQNQFQFPADFQTYSQQKAFEQQQQQQQMGMQPNQQNMSFYNQMFSVDNPNPSGFPNGAPPSYQQNRSNLFRNMMLERQQQQQQMSEMYGSQIGNIRPNQMFNTPSKAPPQYQQQPVDAQQMLLNNSATAAAAGMQSRLSHFSQPDGGLGVVNQNNMVAQMRRGTINAMGRYPAPPSLSRSISENNQFSNFSNPINNNQNYNGQMLLMQKQRQQEQQRQQLMSLTRQRLQQQQQHAQQQQVQEAQQQAQQQVQQQQLSDSLPKSNPSETLTSNSNNNTNVPPKEEITTIETEKDTADVMAIDSVLPSTEEDLDNFLNNPPENFDLFSMLS